MKASILKIGVFSCQKRKSLKIYEKTELSDISLYYEGGMMNAL